MSKFRARQLDATKPIPIYYQEDILDSTEFNNVTNRTVPQLPTGMEKEEETEHHLQQAIFHHRVIPVPEVFNTDDENNYISYDRLYPPSYKCSRQMIHIHPFSADQDIPEYDLDSEDEDWLHDHARKGELLPLDFRQFEEMMDRLEKASGLKAVTLQEAKLLLKDDDDLITAVYDYWLNKRLRLQHALVPQVRKFMVKTEKGVGSAPSDPYVAFRKRTEKMQTRKNRKNDETSYEKMLKLRRDLVKAVTLVELVKRREKVKREQLHLNIELYEKRYEIEDFSGAIINEITSQRLNQHPARPAFAPIIPNHQIGASDVSDSSGMGSSGSLWLKVPSISRTSKEEGKRERRPYKKKRKHLQISTTASSTPPNTTQLPRYTHPPDPYSIASVFSQSSSFTLGSEDELQSHSEAEDDSTFDGYFAFRRKPQVNYLPPRDNFMFSSTDCNPIFGTGGRSESKPKHKEFYLTSLSHPSEKMVGMARRRVGRGGRVWLDRTHNPFEDSGGRIEPRDLGDSGSDCIKPPSDIKSNWPHFHPSTLSRGDKGDSSEESEDVDVDVETVSGVPPSPCFGAEATPPLGEESVASGRAVDGASQTAYYMTAEVLDGTQKGVFTDLHVTLPPFEDMFSVMEDGESDLLSPHTQSETLTSGCSGGKSATCGATTSTTTLHHNSVESDVSDSEWCSGGGKSGITNSSRWTLVNNNNNSSVCSDNVSENVATLNRLNHSKSLDFQTQPASKFYFTSDNSSCHFPVSNHLRHQNTPFTSRNTESQLEEILKFSVAPSTRSHNNSSSIQPISSLPVSSSSSVPIVSTLHSRHIKNSLDLTSLLQSTSTLSKTSLSDSLLGASPLSTNNTSTVLTTNSTSTTNTSSSTSLITKTSEDSKLQTEQNSKKLPNVSSLYFRPSGKDRLNIDSLPSGLILSNNKNNSSNVLNNSNSNLVLSWTNDNITNEEKTVMTNGPSSKTLDSLKCTKVTPMLYPET